MQITDNLDLVGHRGPLRPLLNKLFQHEPSERRVVPPTLWEQVRLFEFRPRRTNADDTRVTPPITHATNANPQATSGIPSTTSGVPAQTTLPVKQAATTSGQIKGKQQASNSDASRIQVSAASQSTENGSAVIGTLKTDLPAHIAALGNVVGYLGKIGSSDSPDDIAGAQFFTRVQGLIRRHPLVDADKSGKTNDRIINFIRRNHVYDGTDPRIRRLAYFDVTPGNAVIYKVGNTAVKPTYEKAFMAGHWSRPVEAKWQGFHLSNGHIMIPQPGFMDCHAACRAMICMAWGMSFEKAVSGLDRGSNLHGNWIESLGKKTGVKPIRIEGNVGTENGKREFGKALQEH